jgi:hypothetical protein
MYLTDISTRERTRKAQKGLRSLRFGFFGDRSTAAPEGSRGDEIPLFHTTTLNVRFCVADPPNARNA